MSSFESCRTAFTARVPEMTKMANAAFRHLDPEAQEEAVQNAMALGWHAYRGLIEQGRGGDPGIITSCVWYAIKQTRGARTLPGERPVKPKDVFTYAQRGRATFERSELTQFIANTTPIPDAVSFRLDVPAFLATLSDRQQRLAEALMAGESTSEVAKRFGVTPGAISQFRASFKDRFETFMAG